MARFSGRKSLPVLTYQESGLAGGEEMPPFNQFEQQQLQQSALDAQQAGQLVHGTPSAAGTPL